jgi:hypothetical protein
VLCCIIEIVVTVYGVVALVTGKITVIGSRVCYGVPARIAGAILAATFPLVMVLAFGYGAVKGASDPNIMQNPAKVDELKTTGTVIEVAVTVICLVAGLGIALAKSEPKRRPKVDLDEEYDERFVRRRRRDDRLDEPRRDDDRIQGAGDEPDERIQE